MSIYLKTQQRCCHQLIYVNFVGHGDHVTINTVQQFGNDSWLTYSVFWAVTKLLWSWFSVTSVFIFKIIHAQHFFCNSLSMHVYFLQCSPAFPHWIQTFAHISNKTVTVWMMSLTTGVLIILIIYLILIPEFSFSLLCISSRSCLLLKACFQKSWHCLKSNFSILTFNVLSLYYFNQI